MPVVTPTRLPLLHSVLERAVAWRREAALAGVVIVAASGAVMLAAFEPLPALALRQCV